MSVLRAPISHLCSRISPERRGRSTAPENGRSYPHLPALGGSGGKGATNAGLHPRGREATVILAAPVWELETLARTRDATPREPERKRSSSKTSFSLSLLIGQLELGFYMIAGGGFPLPSFLVNCTSEEAQDKW